jgi:thiamine-monophosphate kinase
LKNERAITDKLRKLSVIPPSSPVILGIGDDCAIYRPRGSADDLLFTTDLFVEGTHFLRETHKASDVARKALARSLSDIAAMGGAPRFCLVSLCVPRWAKQNWINAFFDTLVANASKAGAVLAGGDLSHGEILVCDVTVCGAVPRGTALRRDRARPGNEIYVSGALGGSALGLKLGKGRAWKRHVNPEPRLALGEFLRTKLRATAGMDLSDGLSLDLQRLCLASGVTADIADPPAFPGASGEQALHGGEDYELLFTVPAGTRVPSVFKGLALTRIGVIRKPDKIAKNQAGEVRHHGKLLPALGYDHFVTTKFTV